MKGHQTMVTAALLGAIAVAVGAFGAHAFPSWLAARGADTDEVARRLDTLEIGARYQMYHALALLAIGIWQFDRAGGSRAGRAVVWLFLAGVVLFSGGLYAFSITGATAFASVVPLGGASFIAGWITLAVASRKVTAGHL